MSTLPLWTGAEILAATSGCCASDAWTVKGVSIDSRTVAPGDLFIAIVGPTNDGHAYIKSAFEKGAVAALVSQSGDDYPAGLHVVVVEDTQLAMEQLGVAARARTDAKIIAVTGSVGKTGTKEALAHCLKAQGKTHYSVGSYNNHWGVPLSLARMPRDTEYGIFELGMNHAGELGPLSKFVRADVGIITTIAAAHLEFFKDTGDIAEAKAEIFEGLKKDGTALINADIDETDLLKQRAHEAGITHVVTFGRAPDADVRLEEIKMLPQSSKISANIDGDKVAFILSVPGEHWAVNILAVLAAIKAVGGDAVKAGQQLAHLEAPGGRGVQIDVQMAAGTFTIIDESYNASPIAMQAAFKVLAGTGLQGQGRKIVVIGDMRELGTKSAEIHASLANDVLESGADMVYACGSNMRHLVDALPQQLQSGYTATSKELASLVVDAIRPEDVVLIKGSLGSQMKVVLDALVALEPVQEPVKSTGV